MSDRDSQNDLGAKVFVLVTGANSGLGFSICCRLVDEFLKSHRHPRESLTVIFTTRSTRKGNDTLLRLQDHLRRASASASAPAAASARVTFVAENVDLSNLVSVRALSRRLNKTFPKLDAIVLNAGLGGWTGINWPKAIWGVMTDLVHEVSWPSFKIAPAGMVTDAQTALGDDKEPRLGAVFCANVFGHYMLAHNAMPLLRHSDMLHGPGRIIWVSSLEATVKHLDIADLPSTAPWVKSFYSVDEQPEPRKETELEPPHPNMFLTHPGICGTGILPLSWPLFYSMLAAFWLARLLGSPWHTISTYAGACAPVWLALSAQAVLDDAEAPYRRNGGGRVKWGSSCNRLGQDQPVCTEVDGWGYGGVVGPAILEGDRRRRRKRGAVDLTAEEKLQYEDLGRKCWQRMEELRIQWDELLDEAEAQAKSEA
ncbi:hypothetical protein KXX10_006790 [Aspergillus fumigatus]|nr:hypothetical protein KXX10_006790 [Aspergillus fumigatus]